MEEKDKSQVKKDSLKKKIVTSLKTLNSALGGRTEVFLAGSVVGGNKRKISKGGNCVG